MSPSILVMPITGAGHNELLQPFQSMIIDSITSAGGTASGFRTAGDFNGVTHLLVPGVGAWGSVALEQTLSQAGQRGVRRVLWQMETLPPNDLPNTLAGRFLLRSSPHRVKGLMRKMDGFALKRLDRECARLAWNQPERLSTSALALPIREARYIKRLRQMGLLDDIIVSLETRQAYLASMSIPSRFMPFGYHKTWENLEASKHKDIDVLFIGTPTPRRAAFLAELQQRMSAEGFALVVVDSGLYGEERNRMIARARIFLHLRNYAWELPRLRFMMSIGGQSLYATEAFHDTRPFVDGKHFIMAPPGELPGMILNYLRDDAARERIVRCATKFASEELDLGSLLIGAMGEAYAGWGAES